MVSNAFLPFADNAQLNALRVVFNNRFQRPTREKGVHTSGTAYLEERLRHEYTRDESANKQQQHKDKANSCRCKRLQELEYYDRSPDIAEEVGAGVKKTKHTAKQVRELKKQTQRCYPAVIQT